jgi:hypothetical protein
MTTAAETILDAEISECAYCGRDVELRDPRTMDDDDWAEEAKHHSATCEWVKTRAHTRPEA